MRVTTRRAIAAGGVLAALSVGLAAGPRVTREDAARMREKVAAIIGNSAVSAAARGTARRTPVLESEVNAYLAFDAGDEIPAGVVEPTVTILGDGQLAGTAIVDLDAVRSARKRGLLDPLGYLSGRLPVSARGTLTTSDGVGRFALQSAEISGVPIPKMVLQELVSYYSRSPEVPDGINLDDPFVLPAGIRQIETLRGQAVVVQ
jgi:hypothetical protein